jgi:cbb3-type cytochrome oxidase subunit 3
VEVLLIGETVKTKVSKNSEGEQIVIQEVKEGSVSCYIVGKTPLIVNRLSEKAKWELLFPKGKKTQADRANNLKHDPVAEFRASAYRMANHELTLLGFPSLCVKRAISAAALDLPGASKAQIGRLTYVTGEMVNLYGTPKLFMAPTRSSDMNRTPDIRTRCIVPEWAIKVEINFVVPILNATTVLSLLSAAGIYNGLGDWRQQKGSASYGQFRILPLKDEKEIKHILQQGTAAQKEAMDEAEPYNNDSAELLSWFQTEIKNRGKAELLAA